MTNTLLARLTRFQQQTDRAIRAGLTQASVVIEAVGRETEAYRDQSGATRASTVCYLATPDQPNPPEVSEAHQEAIAHLLMFDGHDGMPLREPAGQVRQHQYVLVLTSMTDYADALETERGGRNAWMAETMRVNAPSVLPAVVTQTGRIQ